MGFRNVRVFEVKEIMRLWVRGKRGRTLARAAGVDRKTAGRYVGAAQALGLTPNDGAFDTRTILRRACKPLSTGVFGAL